MATPAILKTLGLMTTSEAAHTIGIHRNTIWNAIKQNHLPSRKIGNAIALDPEDVAAFRARYLNGEVTTTSQTPKKKGRPLGAKNKVDGVDDEESPTESADVDEAEEELEAKQE